MAGVLASSNPPSCFIGQALFRSQPFREYSSPYSTTTNASQITRHDSQIHWNNHDDEPSAKLSITPARVSTWTSQADSLGVPEWIDKGANSTGNKPEERGSRSCPITVPDNESETNIGQDCQGEDAFKLLRKHSPVFQYPPGFDPLTGWDSDSDEVGNDEVNSDKAETTQHVAPVATLNISPNQDLLSEAEHRQVNSMVSESSKSEFLDIDSFELGNMWKDGPTDSQEQPCVEKPIDSQPLNDVWMTTACVNLEGKGDLALEMLDNTNHSDGNNTLTSITIVAAGLAAQQPDITKLKRQYQESQAGLNTKSDAAISMNVEASNSAKGNSVLETICIAESQFDMSGEQDDQEHEIDNIISKEEVNGEVHYWVNWAPTLIPLSELAKARNLVCNFEARLSAKHKHAKGQRKQLKSSRSRQPIIKALPIPKKPPHLLRLLGAIEQAQHGVPPEVQKRKRGRPRKQK